MKRMNWEEVAASNGFGKLPAGGYVLRIMKVEDVEKDGYLNITYDVADGNYAGIYSKETSENDWRHTQRKYYGEKSEGRFKAFLDALEASNPMFRIADWTRECNPNGLCGLMFGAVMQYNLYTNGKGENKERIEITDWITVKEIKDGDFKVPAPRDTRKGVAAAAAAPAQQDDDLPF